MESKELFDFHAHILPGADHGSGSSGTSARQIQLYKKHGINKVVATPHFYPQRDSVEEFLQRRDDSCERLRAVLDGDDFFVYQGAEVLVCPGIDRMDSIERLCIKGTNTILLEMPFTSWSDGCVDAVRNIARSGLQVVMAHINRYSERNVEKLCDACYDLDLMYQLNSEIVGGFFAKRKIDRLTDALSVAAIGSDLHGTSEVSVAKLIKLSKYLGKKKKGVTDITLKLLEGAEKI